MTWERREKATLSFGITFTPCFMLLWSELSHRISSALGHASQCRLRASIPGFQHAEEGRMVAEVLDVQWQQPNMEVEEIIILCCFLQTEVPDDRHQRLLWGFNSPLQRQSECSLQTWSRRILQFQAERWKTGDNTMITLACFLIPFDRLFDALLSHLHPRFRPASRRVQQYLVSWGLGRMKQVEGKLNDLRDKNLFPQIFDSWVRILWTNMWSCYHQHFSAAVVDFRRPVGNYCMNCPDRFTLTFSRLPAACAKKARFVNSVLVLFWLLSTSTLFWVRAVKVLSLEMTRPAQTISTRWLEGSTVFVKLDIAAATSCDQLYLEKNVSCLWFRSITDQKLCRPRQWFSLQKMKICWFCSWTNFFLAWSVQVTRVFLSFTLVSHTVHLKRTSNIQGVHTTQMCACLPRFCVIHPEWTSGLWDLTSSHMGPRKYIVWSNMIFSVRKHSTKAAFTRIFGTHLLFKKKSDPFSPTKIFHRQHCWSCSLSQLLSLWCQFSCERDPES